MASSRRGPGLSAFTDAQRSQLLSNHGSNLRAAHLESLQTQLSVFQQLLHQFSITHASEIRKNPTFRAEFARMCNAIGVDPLASSHREGAGKEGSASLWAKWLGGSVNDFFFEVAVRVVEVCKETRGENGGMMALSEVKGRVKKGRGIGGRMEVSDDDIRRAVDALMPLGGGYKVVELAGKAMIRSVPKELNTDQSTVLEAIQVLGYVTVSMLQINLHWEKARAEIAIEDLMADSLLWVDRQSEEVEYWSPTVIHIDSG